MKNTLSSSLLIGTLLTSTISVKAADLSHVIPSTFATGSALRILHKVTEDWHSPKAGEAAESFWKIISNAKTNTAFSTLVGLSGLYSLHKGLVAKQESSQQNHASHIIPGMIRLVYGALILCHLEDGSKEQICHMLSLIGSGLYSCYQGLYTQPLKKEATQ